MKGKKKAQLKKMTDKMSGANLWSQWVGKVGSGKFISRQWKEILKMTRHMGWMGMISLKWWMWLF